MRRRVALNVLEVGLGQRRKPQLPGPGRHAWPASAPRTPRCRTTPAGLQRLVQEPHLPSCDSSRRRPAHTTSLAGPYGPERAWRVDEVGEVIAGETEVLRDMGVPPRLVREPPESHPIYQAWFCRGAENGGHSRRTARRWRSRIIRGIGKRPPRTYRVRGMPSQRTGNAVASVDK